MLANRDIIPGIRNGTLLGVFLGDELCCEDTSARSGMECWDTVLRPVADHFRALLGPDAIIYTNVRATAQFRFQHPERAAAQECGGDAMWSFTGGAKVPANLSIISVDYYAGWLPPDAKCPLSTKCPWCKTCPCYNQSGVCPEGATDPPVSEVAFMKKFVEETMLPSMHDDQDIIVVPGTFACHEKDLYNQTTPMSNASMAEGIVQKLDAWMDYAKSQQRVIGLNPWHLNNREVGEGAHGAPCDMNVGAVAMPTVMEKLKEIGLEIQRGRDL